MDEQQRKLAEELLFSSAAKRGFGKGFYLGAFNSENMFPFPDIDSNEKEKVDLFVQRVEAFADLHIDANMIDRQASIPESVIQGLGELGVLGMTIPTEYGGLGMSQYAAQLKPFPGVAVRQLYSLMLIKALVLRLYYFSVQKLKSKDGFLL